MPAGELRQRLAFEARADLSVNSPPGDGYGNMDGDWVVQCTVAAQVKPLKGGEDVMASRLAGRQPVVIRVRVSAATSLITTDWRARDTRAGTLYNITAIANMDERKRYFDILATAGVAT